MSLPTHTKLVPPDPLLPFFLFVFFFAERFNTRLKIVYFSKTTAAAEMRCANPSDDFPIFQCLNVCFAPSPPLAHSLKIEHSLRAKLRMGELL